MTEIQAMGPSVQGTAIAPVAPAVLMRHPELVDEQTVIYEIDGDRIRNTDDFYAMIGEAVNGPGGYFGRGLDALSDCLRGGFGTPEDGSFGFVWRHSQRPRAALGHAETARRLQSRLARCHPASRPRVQEELEQARQGQGLTVFDWIAGVFAEQQVPLDLQ